MRCLSTMVNHLQHSNSWSTNSEHEAAFLAGEHQAVHLSSSPAGLRHHPTSKGASDPGVHEDGLKDLLQVHTGAALVMVMYLEQQGSERLKDW